MVWWSENVKCMVLSSEYRSETLWSCSCFRVIWPDKRPVLAHFPVSSVNRSRFLCCHTFHCRVNSGWKDETVGDGEQIGRFCQWQIGPDYFLLESIYLDDAPEQLRTCSFHHKATALNLIWPQSAAALIPWYRLQDRPFLCRTDSAHKFHCVRSVRFPASVLDCHQSNPLFFWQVIRQMIRISHSFIIPSFS